MAKHLFDNLAILCLMVLTLISLCAGEDEDCKSLEVYDANNPLDMKILREWYNMVKDPIVDWNTAMNELMKESCVTYKKDSDHQEMCKVFNSNKKNAATKCVQGLSPAECLAVTMYTDKFFKAYNNASRSKNWRPYKVFTSLLLSAIKKLSQLVKYRVPVKSTLYRCLCGKCSQPKPSRIYWTQFTSTSFEENKCFGNTTLYFIPTATVFGASIAELSKIPTQKEVLITPFEAFEVLNKKGPFHFNVSRQQDFPGPKINRRKKINLLNIRAKNIREKNVKKLLK